MLATTPEAAGALAEGLHGYPNPSTGDAPVRAVLPALAGAGARLRLYDALGRACAEVPLAAGTREIPVPVAGLPPGLYLLHLRLPDGRTYSTKLVRE
ncbi:MAG: T9SS type A sorting domain-containing protein [Janthinobacterium lividum]